MDVPEIPCIWQQSERANVIAHFCIVKVGTLIMSECATYELFNVGFMLPQFQFAMKQLNTFDNN